MNLNLCLNNKLNHENSNKNNISFKQLFLNSGNSSNIESDFDQLSLNNNNNNNNNPTNNNNLIDNNQIRNILFSSFVCDWDWFWGNFNLEVLKSNGVNIQIALSYNLSSGDTETSLSNSNDNEERIYGYTFESEFIKDQTRSRIVSINSNNNSNGDNSFFQFNLIYPKLKSAGIVHSKIILIEFESFLRIVISSSNLTQSDWELLGQTIFYVDLKRINSNNCSEIQSVVSSNGDGCISNFKEELVDLLNNLGFFNPINKENEFLDYLNGFDFSVCIDNNIHIISTIPSSSPKDNTLNGILKLKSIVQNYYNRNNINSSDNKSSKNNNNSYELTYQSSAIGNIKKSWFDKFKDYLFPTSNEQNVNIVFPTLDTIQNLSNINLNLALESVTIRYQDSSNSLEKLNILHDYFSEEDLEEERIIPLHSKIIIFSTNNDSNNIISFNQNQLGWIYHGSHNFSEGSWGMLIGNSFKTFNYEAGVWFPIETLYKFEQYQSFFTTLRFSYPCSQNSKYKYDQIPWKFKNHIKYFYNSNNNQNQENENQQLHQNENQNDQDEQNHQNQENENQQLNTLYYHWGCFKKENNLS